MYKFQILLLIFASMFAFSSLAMDIKPFRSDLCTGYAEGTGQEPMKWAHCCVEHDLYLWAGGRAVFRDVADLDLKKCVEETGEPHHARLIYFGVRFGSHSPIKIPGMHWGNAWGEENMDQILTLMDIQVIENSLLWDSSLENRYIDQFIRDLLRNNLDL